MKVLHVLASNKYSGAENVVCQIIKMFDGEIEMAYCSPNGAIQDALLQRNITFLPIKKLSKKELKRAIKEYQPDIIHAHDFRASIIATKATKKLPIISHLHNNSPWLKSYGLKSFLYALTCKRYAKIIAVSDSVFNEFVFGEKYKYKLKVLGNPIDIRAIQEKAEQACITEYFDIGFCGRLTQAKNLSLLIDIIATVQETIPHLRVAMIGDGELREELTQKIAEKNLSLNITLYGFQENPYSIMKQCKLLLLPSLWEGFGLVAVEALALGVPVVCSNVGGLPNIVDDTCGKICGKIENYNEEVIRLVMDNEYHKEKSKYARKKAEELDNIHNYKIELKKLYDK
ncbi:MAG: glycosyltransferase [Clostridia bacterium]|nr:glycosyltransferase [Clostridia bacterium]